MGQTRVELVTPALSERCSNQLSYCPELSFDRKKKERKKDTGKSAPRAYTCTCFFSSSLRKGGDPAAPSGTTTLLRLHPPHKAYLRQRPPCG